MCVIVPDPKLEHAEVLPKKKLEVLQYNNFFILKYQDAASQWSKKEIQLLHVFGHHRTHLQIVCCTVQMILNYMPNEMTIDVHTGKVHQIVRVGDNVDLMCSFIH